MRIGIDTLFENPMVGTGAIVYLQLLIRTLADIDKENDYYVFVSRANRHLFQVDQRNFHYVPYPFSNEKMIGRILEQQVLLGPHGRLLGLDVFFAAGNQMPLLAAVPTVVKIHEAAFVYLPDRIDGAAPRLRTWYRRTMISRAARQARALITNSRTYRDAVCQVIGVDPAKFRIVHDPIDVDFFAPARTDEYRSTLARYAVEGPYLLFVSALWVSKRPEAAIDALRICRQEYSLPHKLVLVGGEAAVPGRMQRLKLYARERGLEDSVVFVGYVSDRAVVRDFYHGADVFLFPSISETFGIPPVEAIAAGCPVVASNRAAVPEIVGDVALIADPDRPEDLAHAVRRILEDPALRADLIRRGLAYAQQFRPEKIAAQTLDVLREAGGRQLSAAIRSGDPR